MAPRKPAAEAGAPGEAAKAAPAPEAATVSEAPAAAAAAAGGGVAEAPPPCTATGAAAAEASAEAALEVAGAEAVPDETGAAAPGETGAAGGGAAEEIGSPAPEELPRQQHDPSSELTGPADEAAPEQAHAPPPEDGQQDGAVEEEDEFWFLSEDWEMWWDEGNAMPVFYDSWTGDKKYYIEETVAVKAKGRSHCPELPEARRIRLIRSDCAGTVNEVLDGAASPAPPPAQDPAQGAAGSQAAEAPVRTPTPPPREAPVQTPPPREAPAQTPRDVVQAASPDRGPRALASDFPAERSGTKYRVTSGTNISLAYRRTLTDERLSRSMDPDVELFGWDASRKWRQCHTAKGYGYMGQTSVACLLLMKPGYVNARRPLLPLEPLAMAAAEDDVGLLKELLAARGNPHTCGDGSRTPLHYALAYGSVNACAFLVHAGARDVAAMEGATAPMKALLKGLDGVDEEELDIKLVDDQVAELQPEAQELVDSMLNDIAERKARQRAQAEEARFREEHNSLLQKLEEEEKEEGAEAEQRRFRDEYSSLALQLEREDEEERIHQRLEQDGQRRLRMRRMREMEAQLEAEERCLRQEAEEAEAERRRVEEERKRWVEEETSEVIKRLQQAQLHFEQIQKSEEEKEARELERKKERFRQRIEAARRARDQEEQEEERLRKERERRMLEKELKARERQRKWKEEEAKEKLRREQLEQLENLFEEQKAAAWTCMECGNDSVFHPDCPGCCMFCGTPQHQGHIAKTWEGWSVGAGGAMTRLE